MTKFSIQNLILHIHYIFCLFIINFRSVLNKEVERLKAIIVGSKDAKIVALLTHFIVTHNPLPQKHVRNIIFFGGIC